MEKRLVLALVLCFLVVIVTPILFPGPERTPEQDTATGTPEAPAGGTAEEPARGAAEEPAEGTTEEPGPGPVEPSPEAAGPALPEHEENDRIEVETDNLVLVFTTRGGALRSAYLKRYELEPGQTPNVREHQYRILREEMVQRRRAGEEVRRSVLTGALRVISPQDDTEGPDPLPTDTVSWHLVRADAYDVVFDLTLPNGLHLTKTWTITGGEETYDVGLTVAVKNTNEELTGEEYRLSLNGPVGLVPDWGDGARVVQVPIQGHYGVAGDTEEFPSTRPAWNWNAGVSEESEDPKIEGQLDRPWIGMANQFFVSALVPASTTRVNGASLWPVRIRERIERLEAELGRHLTSAELAVLGLAQAGSCLSCGGAPPKSDVQRALENELGRFLTEDETRGLGEASLASALRMPFEAPRVGVSETVFSGMLYLGPKEKGILGSERYEILEDVRSLGFFGPISEVLLWILHLLNSVIGNYGVAIIFLTLIVRGALFPLSRHQQLSMQRYSRQMQKLKPKLDEIRKKHKDTPRKLNEEMMKLYKREGVSMVPKGCLVAFLQIPIFIGLFTGLRNAIELRHAGFLWINDLTGPDHLAHTPFLKSVPLLGSFLPEWFNLLPILMTVTWWLSARLQPQPVDPQQQQMAKTMRWMPLIFGVMLYNYTAGLALYMTISSLWSIIESKVVRRILDKGDAGKDARPVISKA